MAILDIYDADDSRWVGMDMGGQSPGFDLSSVQGMPIWLWSGGLDTCRQSLVFSYYCDNARHSILSRYFDGAQDWTRGGARVLQLLLHGDVPDPAGGGAVHRSDRWNWRLRKTRRRGRSE